MRNSIGRFFWRLCLAYDRWECGHDGFGFGTMCVCKCAINRPIATLDQLVSGDVRGKMKRTRVAGLVACATLAFQIILGRRVLGVSEPYIAH